MMKYFVPIILFLISACSHTYPTQVEKELQKMSKENQKKFIKVFKHYCSSKDSLKLKAAYFLVENISDLEFYIGNQINNYNVIFDVLANKPSDYRVNLPWYANEIGYIFDSLQQIYGPFDGKGLQLVKDIDAMSDKLMITYIDQAFEAWNNPWSRHVSFNNFCEYILPYRNFSEPVEDWRPMFLKEFSWIQDSIKPGHRMMDIARILNRDTELKYSNGFDRYIVSIPPSRILQAKYGNCADNSNYKAMIMRSFGIPVSVDYFPQYGSDHNIHFWNAILQENGEFVSFKDSLNDINARVAYKYRIAKVFRRTFSKNQEIQKLNIATSGQLPGFLRNVRQFDVTKEYVPVTDVKVELSNIPPGSEYVFIGVFNDAGWTGIDFAPVKDNHFAYFKDLGREVVYLPFFISENYIVPAAGPFKIDPNGNIVILKPNKQTERVILTRKYHFHQRKVNWLACLVGAKFQGANMNDFSDAVDIATITRLPSEHYNTIAINKQTKYKYIRLVFSPEELKLPYDGDGASIAEIECYDASGNKIPGKPFGSEGRKYNPYTPEKCFDGKELTFFEDARPEVSVKHIGLEFDSPSTLSKIRFMPRNDMNTIQPGDHYELFMWSNNQFVSLGQQVASDTLLIYNNVPKGALLWLRNLSGGREERLFTWENSKQVWW